MTTLYVREGAEYREATAQDIFDRAHALMALPSIPRVNASPKPP